MSGNQNTKKKQHYNKFNEDLKNGPHGKKEKRNYANWKSKFIYFINIFYTTAHNFYSDFSFFSTIHSNYMPPLSSCRILVSHIFFSLPNFISLHKSSYYTIIAESTLLDLNQHTIPVFGLDGSHREEEHLLFLKTRSGKLQLKDSGYF